MESTLAKTQVRPAEFNDHTVQTPALEKDINEKLDAINIDTEIVEPDLDLYIPLKMDGGIVDDHNPLTIRAVVVGICLGCLVNASNLYLGKCLDLRASRGIAHVANCEARS